MLGIVFSLEARSQSMQEEDPWGNDKKAHAVLSAGLAAGGYLVMRGRGQSRWSSFLGSFVAAFAVGALKEITDEKVSEYDLAADATGAFAGSLLFVTFDF